MKKIPIVEFLEAVGSDEKLSTAMRDTVGDRCGSDAAEAIAGFAQGQGYDVDVAGIRQVHQACIEAAAKSRDLTDEELEGVDGGFVLEALAVATIGVFVVLPIAGTAVFAPVAGAMLVAGVVAGLQQ